MQLTVFASKGKKPRYYVRIPDIFLTLAGFKSRTNEEVTITLLTISASEFLPSGHTACILKDDVKPYLGSINLFTQINKKGLLQIPSPMAVYKYVELEYNPYKYCLELTAFLVVPFVS
jgi:hypothetical protein